MRRTWVLAITVTVFLSVGHLFADPLAGAGTEADPYRIENLTDFDEYRSNSLYRGAGKFTQLMTDLDLSANSYVGPVIQGYLYGTFDGNNKTISNIESNGGAAHTAFFYEVRGVVKNLRLTGVNFSGSYTGGICVSIVDITDSVENCYVEGSLAASGTCGGITSTNKGTISNCFADCTIAGGSHSGGLAASNDGGTIENSHSSGTVIVSGTIGYFGGLVGYNYNNGMIKKCYSDTFVQGALTSYYHSALVGRQTGIVRDCFWNLDSNPGLDGYKPSNNDTVASGLTAVEMQEPLHFTIAGWDFAAGTGIWMMPDPGTGPALRWLRDGTYCLYPQVGDLSGDCLVNLVDVAMMASNWLGCGYSDQSQCPQ